MRDNTERPREVTYSAVSTVTSVLSLPAGTLQAWETADKEWHLASLDPAIIAGARVPPFVPGTDAKAIRLDGPDDADTPHVVQG